MESVENQENDMRLSAVEKKHITKVLEESKGQVTKASEILGISRACLYNKMKEYQIPLEELRRAE